jgi:beta-galactosidase/beta-glucuronidase
MKTQSLNGEWQLTYSSLGNPGEKWGRWIRQLCLGGVHLHLIAAGFICDPLIGDNSLKYRWIEEKDWWYRQKFFVAEGFFGDQVEMVCVRVQRDAVLEIQ